MTVKQIPVLLEQLTPEWMTEALRERGHLPEGRVKSVTTEQFGEGVGLMGQIARVKLEYEGAPPATRQDFVVKIPALPGPNRQMGVDYRIYEKEVFFYQRIADRITLKTPKVYYSDFNPENHDFVLLLEDLAPAVVGNELGTTTDDQVRLAMTELAKFHATWWDTDEMKALDWIPYLNAPIWRTQHPGFFNFAWPLWKEKFGDQVSAYVLECGQKQADHIVELLDALSEPPCTIIHMDFRLSNLFFAGPEGGEPFAVCDWQPYSRARGLYDVGYFMSQSIPTEQRRRLQDEVLRLYHETLLESGVKGYSFDQCFHDYRLGSMYTFLYSVGTVAIDLHNETGLLYQKTITERHVAALEDLRAGDVIPA
jgi:hypothetical protein